MHLADYKPDPSSIIARESLLMRDYLVTSLIHPLGNQRILRDAQIHIWNFDILRAATSGYKMFEGTSCQRAPEQAAEFWYFNNFTITPEPEEDSHLQLFGRFVVPASEGLSVVDVFEDMRDNSPIAREWLVPYGLPLDSVQAEIAAMRAFVRLRIAVREPIKLPRSERRRMIRAGEPLPDIRIIQLRQRERGDVQLSRREYHHKWIVSGHWRRLHEPRKEDGAEVTFVSAYVKGPEHAPLLQPRETVYVVAR